LFLLRSPFSFLFTHPVYVLSSFPPPEPNGPRSLLAVIVGRWPGGILFNQHSSSSSSWHFSWPRALAVARYKTLLFPPSLPSARHPPSLSLLWCGPIVTFLTLPLSFSFVVLWTLPITFETFCVVNVCLQYVLASHIFRWLIVVLCLSGHPGPPSLQGLVLLRPKFLTIKLVVTTTPSTHKPPVETPGQIALSRILPRLLLPRVGGLPLSLVPP